MTHERPLVAGFHLIWTAYGWWLPNDPRGSSSHEIRIERIAELGELHEGRRAGRLPPGALRRFYEEASRTLQHELLRFDEEEVNLIGDAFREAMNQCKYTCYACAIMPDHVHALIRKHKHHGEEMIENLQKASRLKLINAKRRSHQHPVWGGPGWKVFLYTADDIRRIVRYIEENPRQAGLPPQQWDFVKAYDGWLPGKWMGR